MRIDISEMTILLVPALLCAACAQSNSRLEEVENSAVNMSAKQLPDWILGETEEVCSPERTCVVGRAKGAQSRTSALEVAKAASYRKLAEIAYPVDVAGQIKTRAEYSNEGGASSSMSEKVKTGVGGRIRDAEVDAREWIQRRVYNVEGAVDKYDAWVLTSMNTSKLNTLYEREKERSRKKLDRYRERLEEARQRLADETTPESFRVGLERYRAVKKGLNYIQPVEGYASVQEKTNSLGRKLQTLLETSFTGEGWSLKSKNVSVDIRAEVASRPVRDLRYIVSADCQDSNKKLSRTNDKGETTFEMSLQSLLDSCAVTVYPSSLDKAGTSTSVGPISRCYRLKPRVDSGGFGASYLGEVGERMARDILGQTISSDLDRCDPGKASREGTLVLEPELSIRGYEPTLNDRRGVWVGEANVSARLEISHRGSRASFSGTSTTVTGYGKSKSEVRGGLKNAMKKVVNRQLKTSVDRL